MIKIKTAFFRVICWIFLLGACPLFAKPIEFNEIFTKISQPLDMSVEFVRVEDNKTIFAFNEDSPLIPASVMKLLTGSTLFTRFPPTQMFKTKLFYMGKKQNSKIFGDLIVVGDGDPFLVSEKLWQMAADLAHLGITEIKGNLIIDNSLFDDNYLDTARNDGKYFSTHAYDAPVSALGVNFNTVALAIAPGGEVGSLAQVNTDPYPLSSIEVKNEVRTVSKNGSTDLSVNRQTSRGGKEYFTASGTIALGSPLKKIYRSIENHVKVSGDYIRVFLKNAGITVSGKILAGQKPQTATQLLEIEGFDLRRIVLGLNTFSNNYIADVLVKRLGAAFPPDGTPDSVGQGSTANGVQVIGKFLREEVKTKPNFIIKDGSGLAEENRISARHLTSTLVFMAKRDDVFPEFLASLPAMGWDGTLKKRFASAEEKKWKGLIRAKTGTLSSPVVVASLGGYFNHPKLGLIAFAIIENGRPHKAQPSLAELRERQDEALINLWQKLNQNRSLDKNINYQVHPKKNKRYTIKNKY